MGGKQDSIGVRLHEAVGLPEPEQEQTPGETRKPLFPQRHSTNNNRGHISDPLISIAIRSRCLLHAAAKIFPLRSLFPCPLLGHISESFISVECVALLRHHFVFCPHAASCKMLRKELLGIRNIKTMLPVGASPTVGEQGYRSVKDRELGIRFDPLASLSSAAQLAREGTF
jgi:hypothetical protein